MSIASSIKSFLGFDNVIETGLKIVEKIAGTDWTPKEKAAWLTDYMEKTKYQSKTRRTIAVVMLIEWALLINVWLLASCVGHSLDAQSSINLANDIKEFMSGNINMGMNAIMSFYFLMGLKK